MSCVAKLLRRNQRQALARLLLSACERGTNPPGCREFCTSLTGPGNTDKALMNIPFKQRMITKHIFPKDYEGEFSRRQHTTLHCRGAGRIQTALDLHLSSLGYCLQSQYVLAFGVI